MANYSIALLVKRVRSAVIAISFAILTLHTGDNAFAADANPPLPLLKQNQQVDWWFTFKFNAATFPQCGANIERTCIFGGSVQTNYGSHFSQQFIYASSADASLQRGTGCAGDSVNDPVGATFEQVYDHDYYFVVWNDQFYDDPKVAGCTKECGSPWGHSKGMVAWNDAGDGFVLQVTTPSWPAAGSKRQPRTSDGNTLGCVEDNDVKVSQHFFALKLNKSDLVMVLQALKNASVVTTKEPADQVVHNGGPDDVQKLVEQLGTRSDSTQVTMDKLSSGIVLISKPSNLHVPPWQMVSSLLDSVPLRAATWWAAPKIATTTSSTTVGCWDSKLNNPGPVEIATNGHWEDKDIGLEGGPGDDRNHAKIGVSLSPDKSYVIFGDMNQQGTLSGNCASSQNGRGGLFYVIDNKTLADNVRMLIKGDTAPTGAPKE